MRPRLPPGLACAAVLLLLVTSCIPLRLGPAPAPAAPAAPPAQAQPPAPPAPQPQSPPAPPPVLVQPLPSVAEVVERVRPAVVNIVAQVQSMDLFLRPVRSTQTGTGVLFDPRGYLVTNNHVVEGARRIVVTTADERSFDAQVVGTDPPSDLAVLKIGNGQAFPSVKFANPDSVQVGDWAIAIGHALGLRGGPTVTVGVVGALDRAIPVDDRVFTDLIQTDAAINPGNSGGPLVNLNGEVVGINTVRVREAEGIGFAVSTFTVVPVVENILKNGRVVWPWLGVSLIDITPARAVELGLPVHEGVLVRVVVRGSPADRAGLQVGDILQAIDQSRVPTVRALQKLMRETYKPGQQVTLSALREGKPLSLKLTLEEMPRR